MSEIGTSYNVISSASSGAPESCDSARPVILTALNDENDQAVEVDGWQCKIDLAAGTIAVCHAGNKAVLARG